MKSLLISLVAGAAAVSPTEKVVAMLQKMVRTGRKEKEEEIATFKKYSQWVHDTTRDLSLELGSLVKSIEKQSAIAAKAKSDGEALRNTIAEKEALSDSIAVALRKETKIRNKEHGEFLTEQTDYAESVDALERAIATLKARDGKIDTVSLLQKLSAKVPRVLVEMQQPQAKTYAYESQGGGVINMLKKLYEKFSTELHDLEVSEANKQHAFNMSKQSKEDEMDNLKETVMRLNGRAQKADEEEADATEQVLQDTASKNTTEATLKETKNTFMLKSTAFKQNQEVRAQELDALSKAISILGGLTDVRNKASFLQVSASVQSTRIRRAAEFLLSSKKPIVAFQMMNLAKVGGPLDKVIGMIRTLITRLEQEHAAEAKHHAFCTKEQKANKEKRMHLQAEVDASLATMEKLKSEIAELDRTAKEASATEADLMKQMAEATEQRNEEKAKNEATIEEASTSKKAVASAIAVLNEFYQSNPAPSLLQQVPEMAEYKGMGDGSKGVIGMLEVIQTDFQRLESDTTADEAESAAAYEKFMTVAEENKESAHKLAHESTMEKDRKEFSLHKETKVYKSLSTELDQANEYHSKLIAACVPVKVSYEERVAMREEEIANLEQAYKILSGEE